MFEIILRHKRRLLIAGIMMSALTVAFIVVWKQSQPEMERFVPMQGVLYDPVANIAVADVDLVSGDTRVRTSESGQFRFGSVSTFVGVKMTHPNLLRAFVILPSIVEKEGENITFYFNQDLLNTLVTVVDLEARDKIYKIYEQIAPDVAADVSREEFQTGYRSIFSTDNITDQSIVVAEAGRSQDFELNTHGRQYRFQEVFMFTLKNTNTDEVKTYSFAYLDTALSRGQDPENSTEGEKVWYLIPD